MSPEDQLLPKNAPSLPLNREISGSRATSTEEQLWERGRNQLREVKTTGKGMLTNTGTK